ncbi:MAG: YCF48-related protein [Pirellulales bacterium]
MRTLIFIAVCIFVAFQASPASGVEPFWTVRSTGTDASLRGMCAVDDSTLWACGSKSTVLRSIDGGTTWEQCGPSGFDKLEFRSLQAFSDQHAIICSAGTPAVILATEDGGKSWQEVYRRDEPNAFFDGLTFTKAGIGIAVSDPISDRLLIVRSLDRGKTWAPIEDNAIPAMREGEAAFAASNSALTVTSTKSSRALLGTGGTEAANSRIYLSDDAGAHWRAALCPIPSGPASGIFSIASGVHPSQDTDLVAAVGGDYRADHHATVNAAYSTDGGESWKVAEVGPSAFRSAVIWQQPDRSAGRFIAVGPTGTDVSPDGKQWATLDMTGFHALAISPYGKLFAVGSDGRFGVAR